MENEIAFKSVLLSLNGYVNTFIRKISNLCLSLLGLWKILLPLLIVAMVLGYFMDMNSTQEKKATLIVQQNFDSANYVYEAIKNIEAKIFSKDSVFLKKHKLNHINEIEIKPIVNIGSVFNTSEVSRDNLETILNEVEVDAANQNESILNSKAFISRYAKHEIDLKINAKYKGDGEEALLNYLNENEFYEQLKAINSENIDDLLKYNTEIITQIDSLLLRAGTTNRNTSNGVFVMPQQDSDLNNLILSKKLFVEANVDLKNRKLLESKTLYLLNKPAFTLVKTKLLSRKMVLFPILALILAFLWVVFIPRKSRT